MTFYPQKLIFLFLPFGFSGLKMRFIDIIGQDNVKSALIQTVKKNRISHAQLFIEQQGSGALALAIAYAQYVSCESRLEEDSCGACPSCLKYAKLEHPDLHFVYPVNTTSSIKKSPISANFSSEWRNAVTQSPYLNLFQWLKFLGIENKQGNISVNESSDILKQLSLKSFESPYKVMILWMVEKLHTSAANKLLKILEEPPEKTLFILITNDIELILPTIISRTQIVKLEKLSDTIVSKGLQEQQQVNTVSADNYAHLAEGDFGRALMLSQENESGAVMMQTFRSWMLLSFNKDVVGLSNWVEEISRTGRVNQLNFLDFGISIFRKAIMQKFPESDLVLLLEHEKKFIGKFSNFVHEGNCIQLIEEFNLAIQHIERNANPKILFMDLSLKVLMLLLVKPSGEKIQS